MTTAPTVLTWNSLSPFITAAVTAAPRAKERPVKGAELLLAGHVQRLSVDRWLVYGGGGDGALDADDVGEHASRSQPCDGGQQLVERGDRHELFADPRHPYTNGLLNSIPRLDAPAGERLNPIPGSVADNLPWDHACAFAPRCSQPIEVCTATMPELESAGSRALRCHNPVQRTEWKEDAR